MRNKDGFLLIEVTVVLSLILCIVLLAMPQMKFLHKQLLFSEVNKIAALCMSLRQKAILTGTMQILSFDVHKKTYTCNGQDFCVCPGIEFGVLPFTQGPPSKPQALITQPISFKDQKITFFPDGAMNSGTLYCTDVSKNFCYALTIPSAQVPVMRLYELQDKWVMLS